MHHTSPHFYGRRTAKVGGCRKANDCRRSQLDQLKPGAFCLHKSWGFGRVADWNLLLNQILIDFEKKKGHPMQLQYAAENLTPIPGRTISSPEKRATFPR